MLCYYFNFCPKEKPMKNLNPQFWKRFDEWLKDCQDMINLYFAKNYTNLKPPMLITNDGSKMIKVIKADGSSHSSYAFVALMDFETKTLGKVNCGDILKPATWKAPAKHARGNIFDDYNGMSWMNPYGPNYLK